jgi:DNA repair photolyase
MNRPIPKGSKKAAYGVAEWADHSVNIDLGCTNDCSYCYAKAMAIRFKRATPKSLARPRTDLSKVAKRFHKREGRIMFPTSHDICRNNIDACLHTLHSMIGAGNDVLIVSKPDPKCIRRVCDEFADQKAQILFRFTIGSASDKTLRLWESGAPSFKERLAALRLAHERGFQTSVSCEPMLDMDIGAVVAEVLPFVTDAVWLGRVNNLRQAIALNCPDNAKVMAAADRLLAEQTDEWLRELYRRYCDNPKIKFKDSIKKAVGLARPTKAGLDV